MVRSFAHRIPWIFIVFHYFPDAYFSLSFTLFLLSLLAHLGFVPPFTVFRLHIQSSDRFSVSPFLYSAQKCSFWFFGCSWAVFIHWNSNGKTLLWEYVDRSVKILDIAHLCYQHYFRFGCRFCFGCVFRWVFFFRHRLLACHTIIII